MPNWYRTATYVTAIALFKLMQVLYRIKFQRVNIIKAITVYDLNVPGKH